MCDWCEGGAMDLVYNKDNTIHGEVDEENGIMTIVATPYEREKIFGTRQVNFCPMCGRPVGKSPQARLLQELSKEFGHRIILDDIENYVGTIGWMLAKGRVSALRNMDDNEILEKYFL